MTTAIVYSTTISDNIRSKFAALQKAKQTYALYTKERNVAWLNFCNACEAEHKSPLKVSEELSNQ